MKTEKAEGVETMPQNISTHLTAKLIIFSKINKKEKNSVKDMVYYYFLQLSSDDVTRLADQSYFNGFN